MRKAWTIVSAVACGLSAAVAAQVADYCNYKQQIQSSGDTALGAAIGNAISDIGKNRPCDLSPIIHYSARSLWHSYQGSMLVRLKQTEYVAAPTYYITAVDADAHRTFTSQLNTSAYARHATCDVR